MDTIKITIIHPDTRSLMEIDAPVSKLKIPIDIFVDGQDVLIIRFKGAKKRRAILEQNEGKQLFTKIKGRIWKFAGVALLTKKTTLRFSLSNSSQGIPAPGDRDSQWTYSTDVWRAASGAGGVKHGR